jgi:uncharacterized membrane protein YidH (DUF202 family)
MSPAAHASSPYRLAGLALAALGVCIARVAPSALADERARAVFTLVGATLAITGLVAIALGVRRRLLDAETATRSPDR